MLDRRRLFLGLLAGLTLHATAATASDTPRQESDAAAASRRFCAESLAGELWSRTELYFGLSRSGGPDVTAEEFEGFLDTEVTPRFPDGLTVLDARGQYRGSDGTVAKEGTKVLVILYPWSKARSRALDTIRERYTAAFDQQSVLRVDATNCISF